MLLTTPEPSMQSAAISVMASLACLPYFSHFSDLNIHSRLSSSALLIKDPPGSPARRIIIDPEHREERRCLGSGCVGRIEAAEVAFLR
jgi:hypothetical protein